jgi:type II secretory pathway component GspD/PulD (secretin)
MQEHATPGLSRTVVYGDQDAGQSFQTTDVNKETIASTVVGRSGELLALGGLISEKMETKTERIPLLADIPYIGKLFEREYKDQTEKELVVLIRPYVILSPDDAEKLSSDFLKHTVSHSNLYDGTFKFDDKNPVRRKNLEQRSEYLGESLMQLEIPLEF